MWLELPWLDERAEMSRDCIAELTIPCVFKPSFLVVLRR
jgi:hypothetical protein